jgi:hypothetical protein
MPSIPSLGEIMNKKDKFKKVLNMVRRHGEIVVEFKDRMDRRRKRKINVNGSSYVSYMDTQGKWTPYGTSCFILDKRDLTVADTIRIMEKHDIGIVTPCLIMTGKKVIKL